MIYSLNKKRLSPLSCQEEYDTDFLLNGFSMVRDNFPSLQMRDKILIK